MQYLVTDFYDTNTVLSWHALLDKYNMVGLKTKNNYKNNNYKIYISYVLRSYSHVFG